MKNLLGTYYIENNSDLLKRTRARVDNPSDAEEVLSSAVETLLRQVDNGGLTRESDIPRFFSVAIASRATDLRRKLQRIGTAESLESGLVKVQQVDESPSPEEILEEEQNARTIVEIIEAERNDKKRLILKGVYLRNKSSKDMAKELDISQRYVNMVVKTFSKECAA